jgi:hypothetical protein
MKVSIWRSNGSWTIAGWVMSGLLQAEWFLDHREMGDVRAVAG